MILDKGPCYLGAESWALLTVNLTQEPKVNFSLDSAHLRSVKPSLLLSEVPQL